MRRTAIRQHQHHTENTENFPYVEGDKIRCSNDFTGEIVTGMYKKMTKDRKKIMVVTGRICRWLDLNEIVIERDI